MADFQNIEAGASTSTSVQNGISLIDQVNRDLQQIREEVLQVDNNGDVSEEYLTSVAKRYDDIQKRITACAAELGLKEELDAHRAAEAAFGATAASQEAESSESAVDNESSDDVESNHFSFDEVEADDDATVVGSDYENDYFQGYIEADDSSVYSLGDDEDQDNDLEDGEEDHQSNNGGDNNDRDDNDEDDNENFGYPLYRVHAHSSHYAQLPDPEDSEEENEAIMRPIQTWIEAHYIGYHCHQIPPSLHPHPPALPFAQRQLRECCTEHYNEDLEALGSTNIDRLHATLQEAGPLPLPVILNDLEVNCIACAGYDDDDDDPDARQSVEVKECTNEPSCFESFHRTWLRNRTLERSGLADIVEDDGERDEKTDKGEVKGEREVAEEGNAGENHEQGDEYVTADEYQDGNKDTEKEDEEDDGHGEEGHSLDDNDGFDSGRPISPFELPPPLFPSSSRCPAGEEHETVEDHGESADDEDEDKNSNRNNNNNNNLDHNSIDLNHPISPLTLPAPISPIPVPRASTPPPPYAHSHSYNQYSLPGHLPHDPFDPAHPLSTVLSARIHSDAVHGAHLTRIHQQRDHIVHLEAATLLQNSIIQTILLSHNLNNDGTATTMDVVSPETASIMLTRISDLEFELDARNEVIARQDHHITHLEEQTDLQTDSLSILQNRISVIGEENVFLRRAEASMAITMDGLMDRVAELEDEVAYWKAMTDEMRSNIENLEMENS